MNFAIHEERFRIDGVFTISRGSRSHADVLRVELEGYGVTGQGECVPYARYGESLHSVGQQIREVFARCACPKRDQLGALLPPGAARNALDCAFWDLEAKRSGRSVSDLLDMPPPVPVQTAYTLSLDSPERMAIAAAKAADRPLIKVKLGGGGEDTDRIKAIRKSAPAAKIIVDANEGWDIATYHKLAPILVELGVIMVEQPLPADQDSDLLGAARPLPVCADESCHDRQSLHNLSGKYDMINIKLDKAGGLSEALALRDAARKEGFKIMIGCMVGTSLAMAPAHILAQGADIVDLDGPLLLADDRECPITYIGSQMMPPAAALWG